MLNFCRPSRRKTLAFYCANIASETAYKNLVSSQYIKPIPNGETILFTISISILLYIIRINGYSSSDPINIILKTILGAEETAPPPPLPFLTTGNIKATNNNLGFKIISFEKIDSILNKYFSKHDSCPHRNSCLSYSISAFVKAFSMGWLAQTALLLWSRRGVISYLSNSVSNYLTIKTMVTSIPVLRFGVFIGGFSAVFKAVNCLLRRSCNGSHDWHAFTSGKDYLCYH